MGVRLYVCFFVFIEESRESCWPDDGRAWEFDGRAQALVGPGLATPLHRTQLKNSFADVVSPVKLSTKANFS